MEEKEQKKSKLCKILTWTLVIICTLGLAYLVYYFFFADDCEDLDEDFFDVPEETAQVEEVQEEEAQAEEKPEEAKEQSEEAEAAAESAAMPVSEETEQEA